MNQRTHGPTTLLIVLAVLLPTASHAQSLSGIGTFLQPVGTSQWRFVRMTPDGEWIFFEESLAVSGCGSVQPRLSRIRTDGTDYEVIVDFATLHALVPPLAAGAIPEDLRISGDGRWLSFAWSPKDDFCKALYPYTSFLVDVEAGTVSQFLHNGYGTGSVTFSDDGKRMAFMGWEPRTSSYWWYVADPDGSSPAPLLDTGQWFTRFGMISPDGKKILFAGSGPPFDYIADVYLYDIASGALRQVSPVSVSHLSSLSCSYDASRIVYSGSSSPIYALNADGSDFHVISTELGDFGSATVTRDGRCVLYLSQAAGNCDVRVNWDGSNQKVIAGNVSLLASRSHRAVNWDGSIVAVAAHDLGCPGFCPKPVAVWNEHLPVLKTYGHGTTGTTLTWDIGSRFGDMFTLRLIPPRGPLVGAAAAHGLGEIGLEHALGLPLFTGVVDDPVNNTGTVQTIVPAVASVIGAMDIELRFRATVFDPEGRRPPETTNITRVTLSLNDGTGSQ